MKSIITKTINDTISEYVSNPYRYFEPRRHHERVLHYLFHDNFFRNYSKFDFVFRYEFPTYQTYHRKKIKKYSELKLIVAEDGDPGNIDVVIKKSKEDKYVIEYGLEFGLFDCDVGDSAFEIHTDNDILKLSDQTNNVLNKILIYFFRCNDFNRTTPRLIKNRVDTVKNRGQKLSDILSTKLNQIESLNIIFIELYEINGKIENNIIEFCSTNTVRLISRSQTPALSTNPNK